MEQHVGVCGAHVYLSKPICVYVRVCLRAHLCVHSQTILRLGHYKWPYLACQINLWLRCRLFNKYLQGA